MILELFLVVSVVAMIYSTLRTLTVYKPRTVKEFFTGELGSLLMFTAMTYAAVIALFCMATGQPVPDYMNLYLTSGE